MKRKVIITTTKQTPISAEKLYSLTKSAFKQWEDDGLIVPLASFDYFARYMEENTVFVAAVFHFAQGLAHFGVVDGIAECSDGILAGRVGCRHCMAPRPALAGVARCGMPLLAGSLLAQDAKDMPRSSRLLPRYLFLARLSRTMSLAKRC